MERVIDVWPDELDYGGAATLLGSRAREDGALDEADFAGLETGFETGFDAASEADSGLEAGFLEFEDGPPAEGPAESEEPAEGPEEGASEGAAGGAGLLSRGGIDVPGALVLAPGAGGAQPGAGGRKPRRPRVCPPEKSIAQMRANAARFHAWQRGERQVPAFWEVTDQWVRKDVFRR